MSSRKVEAYIFECDSCNRTFEEGDFTMFADEPDFEAYEWVYSEEDESLMCPWCVERMDPVPEPSK